jgi:hypothetical protein
MYMSLMSGCKFVELGVECFARGVFIGEVDQICSLRSMSDPTLP